MTETTVQEQKGDTSFWSPWAVFFLGILFAALNWWRMGKHGKAIFFLIISFFVSLLTSWTDYVGGITPTDHAISFEISLARLLLYLAFAGMLATIIASDIKRFKKEEKLSVSVKWQMIFVFWAFLVVAHFGTWKILDYEARSIGECHFPRLQDVVYQKEFEQRTGLATLVLGRKDFSCDWVWDMEINDTLIEGKKYDAHLTAWQDGDRDSYFSIYETITLFDEVTAIQFSKITEDYPKISGSKTPIIIDDPSASNSYTDCAAFDKFTVCRVTLGYQKIVSEFQLTFVNLSKQQIKELIDSVVSINSRRIHEYEAGLP